MKKVDEILQKYFKDEADLVPLEEFNLLYDLWSVPAAFISHFSFDTTSGAPEEFYLNYSNLLYSTQDDPFLYEVVNYLRYKPDYFLALARSVIHMVLLSHTPSYTVSLVYLQVSVYDISTPISQLRSVMINKFVSVSGSVIKLSPKHPQILQMQFQCLKCMEKVTSEFLDGKFSTPRNCKAENCRSSKFRIVKDSEVSADWRRVKIQESANDDHTGVPLTVECEATGVNIDNLAVGDPITVMGIVRAESSDLHKVKHSGLFGLFLQIVSVLTPKKRENISSVDVAQIIEISKIKNIFSVLINSFCSTIYGHEKVKAGLLLALFGGNNEQGRGSSHVLIVGDPGLGKTQLIRTAVNFSERGVYVSATTKAGLTVNFSRENGQHIMKAGALVMADEGICAIDEFDKMGKEQEAMLEAMEQQTITVAKGGIYCSLKASTTVLAAANSTNGHYNQSKTFIENLKINTAILSRFDLIFLLLDSNVQEVSHHIIGMHSGKKQYSEERNPNEIYSQFIPFQEETFTSFIHRTSSDKIIPADLIKKYISYARASVHPRLSQGALDIINDFYVSLRRETPPGGVCITARQIQSLKRLTEARAKVELREVANEQDAVEVIKLLQETVLDLVAKDYVARADQRKTPRKEIGQLSLAKQQNAFIEVLMDSQQEEFTYGGLVTIAKELGLRVGDFSVFVEKLNLANLLLKKPNGRYKFMYN